MSFLTKFQQTITTSFVLELFSGLAIFANIQFFHQPILGWVFFVLYIGLNGWQWAQFLKENFGEPKDRFFWWLGILLSLMLVADILGVTIVLYKLAALSILISLGINSLIGFGLEKLVFCPKNNVNMAKSSTKSILSQAKVEKINFTSAVFILGILYGVGILVVLCLLYYSYSTLRLSSPWQVIHPAFIYVVLVTLLVSAILMIKIKRVEIGMLVVVVQTFFLHSYLALTHVFFYGADGWRYIANETRFLYEQSFLSPALSQAASAFDWGRLSYASLWGLSTFLARLTGVDFINLHKWLMPVLWSVFVPVMVFEIGKKFGLSSKKALFLSWLGLLPFAWQAGGVFTIANNFSFVWFLLLIFLLVSWWQERKKNQLMLLIFLGIVSIFQYGLYFILFWFLLVGGEMVRIVTWEKISAKIQWILLGIISILSIGFIPITEIILKYATWPTVHPIIFSQLKLIIKNLLGWFLAVGPIDQSIGNIIFNQVPPHAFVANLFTVHRGWIVVSMIVLWLLVMVGLAQSLRSRKKERTALSIGFVGLFGGYIISRYFLMGEKVLSRRLENILAFFIILFLVLGLEYFYEKFSVLKKKYLLFVGVVVFSIMVTASYSLGPDEQVVSQDEYSAIAYVWQNIDKNSKSCVIADTFPLLVLESLSQKQIVGGGFPIDAYFSQPERVAIFADMQSRRSQAKWQTALSITQAKECWLVNWSKDVTESKAVFGKVGVWQYNIK